MEVTNPLLICLCRIAYLSEKRVRQDQSKVEDTLSKNRQSTLEVDFKNFFDEARVDACDRIQSFYNSEEEADVSIYYPRLACLIFEVRTWNIIHQASPLHPRYHPRSIQPTSISALCHKQLPSLHSYYPFSFLWMPTAFGKDNFKSSIVVKWKQFI